jgi:2-oxoisovalerate dehydrogenase E1 component alpha subunit
VLSDANIPASLDQLKPIYRILDSEGSLLDPSQKPNIEDDVLIHMYHQMKTLELLDQYLYRAQRMGLISFYMTNYGEEGTHFGTAAALTNDDVVYAQYREAGVLMWRGFTLDDVMNQCFSNNLDVGRGRQMPVHYGNRDFNFHFISSPLATQLPQAPGYAYGMRLSGSKNCVIVYFGDGAAQEGDCHAAMNFAATLGCPVIFLCRNNGYAISTPVEEQYASDGIVNRGIGYGMEAMRVDGNDVFAMYNATKYAKEICVEEKRPVLIEAMTYRLGSHSTSDDQSLYQNMEDVDYWKKNLYPAMRLRHYLLNCGLLDEEKDKEFAETIDADIKAAFQKARGVRKPPISEMFTDVYDEMPARLKWQWESLQDHLKEYGKHYPLSNYESEK